LTTLMAGELTGGVMAFLCRTVDSLQQRADGQASG
jgi:hypothetical protein